MSSSTKSVSKEPVSMERISEALKSIDTKKNNLRRAFEYVQLHASALASPTFQWSEMDEHFNSVKKSLEERFKELESKVKKSEELVKVDKQSSPVDEPAEKSSELELVVIHPELKSLCANMDGIGLQTYVLNHRKGLQTINKELNVAFRSASDPSKLVLDAMGGFYPLDSKPDKGRELASIRVTCLVLLEELMVISPQIKPQVKEEAKKLAVEWKEKISPGNEDHLEPSAFFQLLATYGLTSEFNVDELLDMFVSIAWRKQAVNLFRALKGFADKILDLIQNLISKGKQLDAVRFVYAFELVDKFPTVPLIKAYLKKSKKVAQEVRKKGNNSIQSQNEASSKEIASLRAAIKCIEEHQLETQFPREGLDKRIELLKKQKADRKRLAMAPAKVPSPNPQQQQPPQPQQQQIGNNRPWPAAPNTGAVPIPTVALNSQIYPQSMGLQPDQMAPYWSSFAQYGWAGATTTASQYLVNAEAGPPGVGVTPLNVGVNLNPYVSHLYSSEPHMTPDLYQSMVYGGYAFPPSYSQPSFN